MIPESRRRKLEMLTRSIAAGKLDRAGRILDGVGHAAATPATPAEPLALERIAAGIETPTERGTCWLIRRTLAGVSADELEIQRTYAAVLRGSRKRFDELEASAALCHVADGLPEGPLFMDLETCGLAGTPIFLVGLMSYRDGGLVFEQLLARDYSEEAAIVAGFAERLAGAGVLVTFNGKSFDMTQLRDRAAFHGLDLGREPPHLDLLHECRRRWRGSLPNCRLQTLERTLCGRHRSGDIPGAEIPAAYHRFVDDGDACRLQAVLHHNLLDLLTMSQLVCCLLAGESPAGD
jgi:uncharacterized protein YprB with RNaseH-like and TPR domain